MAVGPVAAAVVPPARAVRSLGGRDPWFDNARLVAVVLVVLGHCMIAVTAVPWTDELWAALWPFRIPALAMLAGLFSSEARLTRWRLLTLARDLLIVFVVFSVLESVQTWLNGGSSASAFVPEYGLWFLLSLFCWRVALPFLALVPHVIAWAFAAALLAGFVGAIGPELGVSRTIAYFPLFLLGWRLRAVDLHARPERRLRRTCVVAAGLLSVLLLVLSRASVVDYLDLRMQDPYSGDLVAQVGEAFARAGVLAAGAVGALALVGLMPRRTVRRMSYLGAGSMYIYLLHLPVMKQAIAWGWFDAVDSVLTYALMLVVASAAALALASPPVRRVTRPLVQPRSIARLRVRQPDGGALVK